MVSMFNGYIYPLSHPIFHQFCLKILSKIHHKIQWLNLKSSSVELIFLTIKYLKKLYLYLFVYGRETFLDGNEAFKNFKYNNIMSCVDHFPKAQIGQCHIYSYLYELEHYGTKANNFPGGIFKCVRKILLFDERSFEHEFFLRTSQSFPMLKNEL
ncbi:unnamed protein product [Rotaria sp. Silwood1]|nr:unnamed protein product [Rotaria sp. Silwood1]